MRHIRTQQVPSPVTSETLGGAKVICGDTFQFEACFQEKREGKREKDKREKDKREKGKRDKGKREKGQREKRASINREERENNMRVFVCEPERKPGCYLCSHCQ